MSTQEPSGGRVGTPEPDRGRAWADLTLDELRAYRRRLSHEEERVSYWRRLLHARIDVLEAQAHQERALTIEELVRVLGDTGSGRGRTALVSVQAADPLPDLPVLEEIWVTDVDPNDKDAVAEAVARLHNAERQLTEYRRALHERLDTATEELIGRYREHPASALVAFREPHTRPGGVA
ncbi:MAG TPA: hypothetical protein VFV40_01080 [Nocardioides sp.]|nr:hypothetical protein [Nocardioides sp.]